MAMIMKSARLEKAEISEEELKLINQQTLRPMGAEELFVFRLAACDNQVDRDWERFTESALDGFSRLFVGRPVLRDHNWQSETQTARVYAANVEQTGESQRLILRCYMPRTAQTEDTITRIESGILRECSVGCAVRRVLCSICGANQAETLCRHFPGREYDGQVCHMDLDGAADAYEVSLVAVPAQPAAGTLKAKRYGGTEPPPEAKDTGGAPGNQNWREKAALALETEKFKFDVDGGIRQ